MISLNKQSRMPPAVIDVEKTVLSIILQFHDSITTAPFLKPEMFYKIEHELIFNAALKLSEVGTQVDIITVSDYLRKQDKLDIVGGDYYIMQLTNEVTPNTNIQFYARLIQQEYIKRKLITISAKSYDDAFDNSSDGLVVLAELENSISELIQDNFISSDDENVTSLVEQIRTDVKNAEKGIKVGESTGIDDLDNFYLFEGGMVYLLAARAGAGKTSFAITQFAKHILEQGKRVVVSSLEMPNKQVLRWLALSNGAEQRSIKYGTFYDGDRESYEKAMDRVSTYNLHFTSTNTLNELISNMKMILKKNKVSLWIIDYVQQILIPSMKGNNRNAEIDLVMTTLKAFAKKYNIPILVLSQLNREVEKRADKHPQLSDLRDSGSLEQLSDVVMALFRAEYYDPNSYYEIKGVEVHCKGILKVLILKNKDGETGNCFVRYNENLKNFYPYEQVGKSSNDFFDTPLPNTYEPRLSQNLEF